MRESDTYLAILDEGRDEGRLEQMKKTIFRLGRIRLGPPDNATTATLTALTDLERLERMSERLMAPDLSGWQDLMDTP